MIPDADSHHTDGTQSGYIPHLNRQLAQEYARFNASLSPEQKALLGVTDANPTGEIRPQYKDELCVTPRDYGLSGSGHEEGQGNLSNIYIEALTCRDQVPMSADEISQIGKKGHIHILVVFTIIRRVLRIFECASDPVTRLHGDVVALALGLPGYTVGNIARAHGCTRQNISKRMRRVIHALDLPPTYKMQMATVQGAPDYTRHGKPLRKPSKHLGDISGRITSCNGLGSPASRLKAPAPKAVEAPRSRKKRAKAS